MFLSVLYYCLSISEKENLTCLTCAGYDIFLLALPYGDGHVVNGDIPLKTRASNSFKNNLFKKKTKKQIVDSKLEYFLEISNSIRSENVE